WDWTWIAAGSNCTDVTGRTGSSLVTAPRANRRWIPSRSSGHPRAVAPTALLDPSSPPMPMMWLGRATFVALAVLPDETGAGRGAGLGAAGCVGAGAAAAAGAGACL